MEFETLSRWADAELQSILSALPAEIRQAAARVPVSMEEKPGAGEFDHELMGDELGLFEGSAMADDPDAHEMPRIRLFLLNLWDWVEGDRQDFLDEVGTTFLHELGHFLGWNEEELEQRGLD